jgi:hypothetical protein
VTLTPAGIAGADEDDPLAPGKDRVRVGRYWAAIADRQGPVRGDILPVTALFDEPFYQLVRPQLLAHALERSSAEGATRVRVVHVLSPANDAYQRSLARPEHRALGETVSAVWQQLLRATNRFVSMDPATFLDAAVTSPEYVSRYGERMLHNDQHVLDEFGIDDLTDLEDVIDFDGEISSATNGLELRAGTVGTVIEYPFSQDDLQRLSEEVEGEYAEAIDRAGVGRGLTDAEPRRDPRPRTRSPIHCHGLIRRPPNLGV